METNFQSVEQMWQSFKSAVDSAKDKYVPVRKTASRFTHPWIDTKLRRLAKRKIRAYKKAQRTGSPADWTRYRNLKTSTQREIRTSHRNYMKGMVTSDQKDKPKRFWSYVKAKKQESTGVAPLKNEDGFIHSNSQSKAEILNAQFQSVYTKEDLSSMPDKGPSPYPSMDSILFSTKGVHKQLSQLNSRKATGPDNISTAILRLAADELAPVLTRLYPFSHDQGTVPQDWRDAHIVPVFKKGERHQPSNYRPVSLTSVVSKIMEHIIHSSIMRFYDNHKIHHDCQHGFRSKRSCETQLIGTLQSIASKMKGKNSG